MGTSRHCTVECPWAPLEVRKSFPLQHPDKLLFQSPPTSHSCPGLSDKTGCNLGTGSSCHSSQITQKLSDHHLLWWQIHGMCSKGRSHKWVCLHCNLIWLLNGWVLNLFPKLIKGQFLQTHTNHLWMSGIKELRQPPLARNSLSRNTKSLILIFFSSFCFCCKCCLLSVFST